MIVDIAGSTVDLDVEDGDIITDVVVIARIQDLDKPGEEVLVVGHSPHTGFLMQRGMVEEIRDILGSRAVSDE